VSETASQLGNGSEEIKKIIPNLGTGGQVFGLSFPLAYARKSMVGVVANGCNDSKFCILVDQIHFPDLACYLVAVFLMNAVPVYPNITVAKSFRYCHCICNRDW
jgi:hypothetical protein